MARIPGTFCSIEYSYYRDILITMSGEQKKQSALIPDGVDPSDYEYRISDLTTSGPILQFGTVGFWTTLPVLGNVNQTHLIYSMEVNVDESAPVGDVTCWAQLTLTVRKKSNHSDYASGVIKLVPTLSVNGPPPPPLPLWDNQYTIGVITSAPGSNNGYVQCIKESFFNTDGTWSDTNNANASYNRSGRWLPAGVNGANYSMRASNVTTLTNGSQAVTINGDWQKMNVQRKIGLECIVYRPAAAGNYETRWYGIIDIRNDLTGKIEYSGWFYSRAIVTLT